MVRIWATRMLWTVLAVVAIGVILRLFTGNNVEAIIDEGTGEEAYQIVSLLPRDAIPAIDHPEFVSGVDADSLYHPDELVLGLEIEGDARAYSIPFLSGHEIVNDEVGGVPIAVTW